MISRKTFKRKKTFNLKLNLKIASRTLLMTQSRTPTHLNPIPGFYLTWEPRTHSFNHISAIKRRLRNIAFTLFILVYFPFLTFSRILTSHVFVFLSRLTFSSSVEISCLQRLHFFFFILWHLLQLNFSTSIPFSDIYIHISYILSHHVMCIRKVSSTSTVAMQFSSDFIFFLPIHFNFTSVTFFFSI